MEILLQIWFRHIVMLGGCAARLGPSNLIMFRKLARVQVSARYHWWRLNFQCCYSMKEAAFEHGSTFGNLKRSWNDFFYYAENWNGKKKTFANMVYFCHLRFQIYLLRTGCCISYKSVKQFQFALTAKKFSRLNFKCFSHLQRDIFDISNFVIIEEMASGSIAEQERDEV